MYEDKKRKLKINWKSLIIKMLVFLLIVFIIMWLIALVNKNKDKKPSNIGTNLKVMQEAANEYFTISRLPDKINDKRTITLEEMIDSKLLVEFKDQNGKACDLTNSYAEATKISDEDYTIKVKLICGKENDYVIDTISVENEPIIDNNTDNSTDNNIDNNEVVDNQTSETPSSTTTKPSTSQTTKPSNSTTNSSSSTSKPSTSTQNSGSSSSKPTNTEANNTCSYGDKQYFSTYPLAYEISGNCAASKDAYLSYGNKVNPIGTNEYLKIREEVSALATKTNTNLYVEAPQYIGVYNKANTGLVGYQIKFVVKQNMTYSTKIIYEYYIDSNGNRKAVIDNRASLNTTSNNLASNSLSITLNTNNKTMNVGDTFQLIASVNQSNKIVKWNTNNSQVASVTQNGLVKALSQGTAIITAQVDNKSVSARITVNDNNIVSNITLNTNSQTLYVGDTFQLIATITPSNTNKTVTFKSDNDNIATVDQTGRVYAKSTGSVRIWATVDGKSVSALISVLNKPDVKIVVLDTDLVLHVGESHKIQYKVYPEGVSYNKRIYFYVENAGILTINEGVITAKGVGTTRIIVTIDGEKSYINVTVK